MPEISENSHKISAAQLFCILLLMRVSSELAYPSKGGFGGSGLAGGSYRRGGALPDSPAGAYLRLQGRRILRGGMA